MLAYFAIFTSSIAGFAGGPLWIIAAAAIALSALSQIRYGHLYQRGREAGLLQMVDQVMLRSFANAFTTSAVAYGFGWLLRFC